MDIDTTVTVSDGVLTRVDFNAGSGRGGIAGAADKLGAAGSVTPGYASFTTGTNWVVIGAAFKAAAASSCAKGSLLRLGVGCGIWAAKKIEENPRLTRRDLIVPRKSLLVPRTHADGKRLATRRGLFIPRKANA